MPIAIFTVPTQKRITCLVVVYTSSPVAKSSRLLRFQSVCPKAAGNESTYYVLLLDTYAVIISFSKNNREAAHAENVCLYGKRNRNCNINV